MRFLNQFQHLLPRGRAWSLIVDKPLRRLFVGLSVAAREAVAHIDRAYLDLFPDTTTKLTQWEQQFNLRDPGLTDQERRDRLTATWRAQGGQSVGYIEDTLQAAGFQLYVHEWFDDSGTARNPGLVLRDDGDDIEYRFELGTTEAELGDTDVELGSRSNVTGYLLVNKISDNDGSRVEYTVPANTNEWPFILYVGGETFPESATIRTNRRDEFEELLLSICPGQQWLGVLVEFGASDV